MPEALDPADVAEVRRRVVDPVVRSLVGPDELEEISVTIVEETSPFVGAVRLLRVTVRARGEWIERGQSRCVGEGEDRLWDAEEYAAELYDGLRDELAESRLSWGVLRDGEYTVLS